MVKKTLTIPDKLWEKLKEYRKKKALEAIEAGKNPPSYSEIVSELLKKALEEV